MKRAVLVLTNSRDGEHSDVVIAKLRARGERVVRFDSDRIASGESKITVSARNGRFTACLRSPESTFDLSEIKSVWYRRPQWFNSPIADPVQRQYAEDELSSLLFGIWHALPENTFWMNHPSCLDKARRKVYQLKLAQEIGFSVPRTLITNSPDEARAFIDACGGQAVFKAIHRETLDYGPKHLNIPTTLISESRREKLCLLHRLPSLFQEALPKRAEVRMTVVGNRIFAARATPKQGTLQGIDWRHPEALARLQHTLVTPPRAIAERCLTMMRTLNLAFAALDFVILPNGRWIFLEINPNGQWYWIEHLTGALISDTLADTLSTANPLAERR